MYETIELGSTPHDEDCTQVSRNTDYGDAMRAECMRYRDMLERRFPFAEDHRVRFVMKREYHDFGPYYEVAVKYPFTDDEACDLCTFIENNCPGTWDDEKVFTAEDYQQWKDNRTYVAA